MANKIVIMVYNVENSLEDILTSGNLHLKAKEYILEKYGLESDIYLSQEHPLSIYPVNYSESGWQVRLDYNQNMVEILRDYFVIAGLPNTIRAYSDFEAVNLALRKHNKTIRTLRPTLLDPKIGIVVNLE